MISPATLRCQGERWSEIFGDGDVQCDAAIAGDNGEREAALGPTPGAAFEDVPAIDQLRGGRGGEGAGAQQADHALVALRVPEDRILGGGDHPVADFPAGAVEQGAQAGLGEDPIVGAVAAQAVAGGEEGDAAGDSRRSGQARSG